jgi:hypothetical protein
MLDPTIKDWIDFLFKIISTVGVVIAVITYRRNLKVKHAEWLWSLYQKFFENEQLKTVRKILIYHPDRFEKLFDTTITEEDEVLIEKVDDFLNFFEFIASLNVLNQISEKEIDMMFDYYLTAIYKNEHLKKYIKTEGFENLTALIQNRKRRNRR